uniref:Small ribosomal subunit protein uS3m n=1 Tax=Tephrocybe rancida TaxID=117070 RepID=A0A386TY62_9AGAR|nr:ribosomal protein S3 [Tephrocybe rancida]AYE93163.1 ribosomal protein S3 [Tephrocybe rancida]
MQLPLPSWNNYKQKANISIAISRVEGNQTLASTEPNIFISDLNFETLKGNEVEKLPIKDGEFSKFKFVNEAPELSKLPLLANQAYLKGSSAENEKQPIKEEGTTNGQFLKLKGSALKKERESFEANEKHLKIEEKNQNPMFQRMKGPIVKKESLMIEKGENFSLNSKKVKVTKKNKDIFDEKESLLTTASRQLRLTKVFNGRVYDYAHKNPRLFSTELLVFKKSVEKSEKSQTAEGKLETLNSLKNLNSPKKLRTIDTKKEYYLLTLQINKYFFILTKFILALKQRSFIWNVRLFMPKRILNAQPFVRVDYKLKNLKKTSVVRIKDLMPKFKISPKGYKFDADTYNYKEEGLTLNPKSDSALPFQPSVLRSLPSPTMPRSFGENKTMAEKIINQKRIMILQKKLIVSLLKEGIVVLINLNFLIQKKKKYIKNIYNYQFGDLAGKVKLISFIEDNFKERPNLSEGVLHIPNCKASSTLKSLALEESKTLLLRRKEGAFSNISSPSEKANDSHEAPAVLAFNRDSLLLKKRVQSQTELFEAPKLASLPFSLRYTCPSAGDKATDNTLDTLRTLSKNKVALVQKPVLSHYLKEMSIYNLRSKGIFIFYCILIGFHFNKESNKFYTSGQNIYKLLEASFKSMYCLISKPVFITTPDKLIVQLFYYLFIPNVLKLKKFIKCKPPSYGLQRRKRTTSSEGKGKKVAKGIAVDRPWKKKNKLNIRRMKRKDNHISRINLRIKQRMNKNRKKTLRKQYNKFRKIKFNVRVKLRKLSNISLAKVFPNKFKFLSLILNKIFKKPVEFDLIRTHYPYNDSNILVNLLGIMINKIKLRIIIRRFFVKAIIKNINSLKSNRGILIPAFLSGLTIRVAGRLLTHKIVPRKTVKTSRRGASATGRINFKDTATYTNKNKRGAFSITVKAGHNFF